MNSTAQQHRISTLTRLRKVRDRIDREYAHPLDVQALAEGVSMSAGYLSREFKRAYGESPYSYLMTRRIERAMTLLRFDDRSVTDVCFTVGFSSLGTFSSRFSELVGLSPSAYRRAAIEAGVQSGAARLDPCIDRKIVRPVRNQEAPPAHPLVA